MVIKNESMIAKYVKIICFLLGIIFFSLGFLLLVHFNSLYDYIIKSAMRFTPESESFKAWKLDDPPLVLDIYLFNWTNPEDLRNSSIKPRFEQVGPYRFHETKEKVNITWHPNNTISYNYIKRYYFMEDESPRKMTDNITLPNPVALTAAYNSKEMIHIQKIGLSFLLKISSHLYVTKTAAQFLFDGFGDGLLQTVRIFSSDVQDKFGFLYKRNETVNPDELLMYTEVDENFGKLLGCNGRNRTNYYKGKCGIVRGSAGEFFPMNSEPSFIEIFSGEMCTYAHLEYEKNVTVKGVTAYKYGSRKLFDNGTLIPDNSCYCNGECIPTGVLNVSICRNNAPIFLSLPHFYNADPYYTSLIDGMSPNKENHELFLVVEPKSSIVVDFALRMQINMLLQPYPGLSMFDGVPTIFVPMIYFDQRITMSDELAEKINSVIKLPSLAQTASIGMIISGGVVIGISILLFVFHKPKRGANSDVKKVRYTFEDIPLNSET